MDPIPVTWYSADSALSEEKNAELVRQAALGTKPGLAETLFSDARFALQPPIPDFRQAVLLAAIACEVKVKDVLVSMASPDQRPVLNLLLENPRDWSMGAASLFDKAMEAVCSRLLRKEDPALYKDVDLLYQNRNKIAHRGGTGLLTDDVLRGHVVSAGQAFAWLDGIVAGP